MVLKRMFGGLFGTRSREPDPPKAMDFAKLPDGEYAVRYVREDADPGNFVLVSLEVVAGEYAGDPVPMLFDSRIAQQVSRDYTGGYLERMAYEGDARAGKLESAKLNAEADSDGVFLARINDGLVTSVPDPNTVNLERYWKRLGKLTGRNFFD